MAILDETYVLPNIHCLFIKSCCFPVISSRSIVNEKVSEFLDCLKPVSKEGNQMSNTQGFLNKIKSINAIPKKKKKKKKNILITAGITGLLISILYQVFYIYSDLEVLRNELDEKRNK